MNEQDKAEANIYTLTQILRGFSNEMTVQQLASMLNVSYSTLARCKSGTCPPSITFQALKNAFDTCKDLYFEGSDRLIVDAIIEQLRRSGCPTEELSRTYEAAGYGEFVNKLLSDALANSKKDSVTQKDPEADRREAKGAAATDTPSETAHDEPHPMQQQATGGIAHGLAGWVPIIALVAVGLLQVPLDQLLGWIADNMLLFVAISLAIAASPVLLGLTVDAPIAWMRYKKRNERARFSWSDWREVAKYGDPSAIVRGEGRYNAAGNHIAFGLLCNVAGALCAVSLSAFLSTLPEFIRYFSEHNWTEYFKAAMVLGFFIAYHHTESQQNLPYPTTHGIEYNPDNYRYTRAHVWANIVHLIWVITLSAVFALCMLGYSVSNFQRSELPLSVLWPVAQTVLFLVYANVSPYAMRVNVSSVGSFASSLVAIAVCMIGMVSCFKPSWTSAIAIAVYAAIAGAAFIWRRRMDLDPDMQTWLARESSSRVYGVLFAAVTVGLTMVGMATNAIA